MNHLRFTKCLLGVALGLGLLASTARADDDGALFTMDNSAAANHVLVFRRGEQGQLVNAGSVATGGSGTGTQQGCQARALS